MTLSCVRVPDELPDVQAGFRKGRRTKLPDLLDHQKKQERSRKTSTSALLTMSKPLTLCITTNYGKFLKSIKELMLLKCGVGEDA